MTTWPDPERLVATFINVKVICVSHSISHTGGL